MRQSLRLKWQAARGKCSSKANLALFCALFHYCRRSCCSPTVYKALYNVCHISQCFCLPIPFFVCGFSLKVFKLCIAGECVLSMQFNLILLVVWTVHFSQCIEKFGLTQPWLLQCLICQGAFKTFDVVMTFTVIGYLWAGYVVHVWTKLDTALCNTRPWNCLRYCVHPSHHHHQLLLLQAQLIACTS